MDIYDFWQEREEIRAKGLVAAMDAVWHPNDYMRLMAKAISKRMEEQDRLWAARNQDGAIWSSPDPDIPVGTVCYDAQADEYKIRREGGSWTSLSIG